MRIFTTFLFLVIGVVPFAQRDFPYLDSSAFSYLESNNYEAAERAAGEILEIANKDGASIYQINAYTILGIVNKNRGYYHSSIENYLNALKYSYKIGDTARSSACLNNIGIVYKLQKKYSEAISYFRQSLHLEEGLNNELQRSIRLYNLADAYLEVDSLNLALSYFTNSLIIEEANNNLEGLIYAKIGIGNVYLKRSDYLNLGYLLEEMGGQLLSMSIELRLVYRELSAEHLLGIGQLSRANEQLDSAMHIADQYELSYLIPELLRVKIKVLEAQEQWRGAARWYKRYVQLTERLNSEEIDRRIDELSYNYQLQKKQFEIEALQKEKELEQMKREKSENLGHLERRLILYILGVIIFIIIFIVLSLKKIGRFIN